MNPAYRDKLTDLGISDRVVEEIQALNEEYFDRSLGYAHDKCDDYEAPSFYDAEYYLQSEGFIR